ncbi:MAG: hypothetical protein SVY53_05130 [Chloroflexota bacterium]|nr:hypothetical protein [Chloroflexota bacterium]
MDRFIIFMVLTIPLAIMAHEFDLQGWQWPCLCIWWVGVLGSISVLMDD